MTPTTLINYATCQPFSLPEQTDNSPIPYVPKIIVCDNSTNKLLSTDDVRGIIQLSAIQDIGYQCLTHRRVLLIEQEIAMARIESFLNPESVSSDSVRAIFRNHRFNSFSLFSLLPRENTQSMTAALPPVSNDGTQASASADAVASTPASTPVQEQQADPSQPLKREGKKTVHSCGICDRAFATSRAHRDHMAVKHDGDKPYPCPHSSCDKTFSYASTRSYHIRKHHVLNKPYPCMKCDKEFIDHHGWKVHQDTHSTEKRHKCKFCPKAFKHESTFYKHMRNEHPTQK